MTPDLSVVIPTYNGAERLRRCLDSLCRQTLPPHGFETIVVVDGSTDDTVRMLEGSSTPFRLASIAQRNQGAGAARNAGVEAAQGTYCVFLDDDIIAHPQLLAEHLRVQRARVDVVGLGAIPTIVRADAGWLARCFAESSNRHCARLASGSRSASWWDCYSGNMSVPRAAFAAIGGFATDMRRGEDVELGYRLAERGLSFIYVPEASGTEEQRKTAGALMSDFEENAVAAAEIYRRHPPALPHVIADFSRRDAGPVWLRRLLLTSRIPPRAVAALGRFAGKERWIQKWYSITSDYCYWRGLRRGLADAQSWWQITHGTPIFKYRTLAVADDGTARDVVAIRRFARQMAWLSWTRHRVLSLERYCQYRRECRLPPPRAVVVTIDEADAPARSLADAVLRRYGDPESASLMSGDSTPYAAAESPRDRRPPSARRVNNHRTPLGALYRTEIHGTDSLLQFAWKVARARGAG